MKPFVVLAGPIHADGIKLLESEARVLVSSEETEAGMLKVAQEAEGILFRAKPACTRSLMAGCKQLKVVGRHGVGLDTIDLKVNGPYWRPNTFAYFDSFSFAP